MKNLYLFVFLGISLNITAQEISNIQLKATEDLMIIKFDLSGDEKDIYEVTLELFNGENKPIKASSFNGDIGKVVPGKEKTIVWNVYKDVDELEGEIVPRLQAHLVPPEKPQTKVAPKPRPAAPTKTIDIVDGKPKKNKKKLRVGMKLGIGPSNVIADDRSNFYKNRFSIEAGLYLRYYLTKKLHLQPEIVYKPQNYQELLNDTDKLIHKHDYVRGQMVLGLAPLGGGLHFNIGGYYGYLVHGSRFKDVEVVSNQYNIDDINTNNQDRFPFSDTDAGLLIGGSWSIFRGAFVIGVQHSRGLTNFVTDDYQLLNENIIGQSLRNKSTQFYFQKSF